MPRKKNPQTTEFAELKVKERSMKGLIIRKDGEEYMQSSMSKLSSDLEMLRRKFPNSEIKHTWIGVHKFASGGDF